MNYRASNPMWAGAFGARGPVISPDFETATVSIGTDDSDRVTVPISETFTPVDSALADTGTAAGFTKYLPIVVIAGAILVATVFFIRKK
jgi:hypothetical protein